MSTLKTRKVGRPRTAADGGKRDQKVVVYVSSSELAALRQKAKDSDYPSYSAFVRDTLLATVNSDPDED